MDTGSTQNFQSRSKDSSTLKLKIALFTALFLLLSACSTTSESTLGTTATSDAATLYIDCPLSGTSIDLSEGDYTAADLAALGMPNDKVSAIRVQNGFEVEIFADTNYQGKRLSFREDDTCLVDDDFNDVLSSVRVIRTDDNPTLPAGERLIDVDFQSTNLGNYTISEVQRDFPGYLYGSENAGGTEIREEGDNRFMRSRYLANEVGPQNAGNLWAADISDAGNEIVLSYRVRFLGKFDFVRSGKLAGVCGGTCTSGGDPQDPNQEGWSWRDIWRRNGGGAAYLYYPGQSGTYGDEIGWSSGFPTNEWIDLKTRIRLNTPGQNNGVVQTWKNGELVLDKQNARIRQNASTGFDRFLLISFFGGATSDFAASKDEYIDFDDFVVSKQ